MMRRSAFVVVAVVAALVGLAVPASAVNPGPPQVPALVGSVRDGCTGVKVANLSVSLTDPVSGAVSVPDVVSPGHFVYKAPGPGGSPSLVLNVSAPGYDALGDAAAPGVTVFRNPGPIGLPAPEQMAVGLKATIFLAPNPLPVSCPLAARPHRSLPTIVGGVRDATTGLPIAMPTVSVCFPPNPCQPADTSTATGHFVYKNPGPNGSPSLVLNVSAPGYPPLGDAAAPGVTLETNPGPIGLPAVQFMSVGLVTKILL
jgi:hypothetical protein